MSQPKPSTNLSYAGILKIILVLAAVVFLYIIREVVALVFVAIVFAAALDPFVDYLEKFKIPRSVSVLLIYLIIFAVFSLVIVLLIPPVAEQVASLARSLPDYYQRMIIGFKEAADGQSPSNSLPDALSSLSSNLAGTTKGVFSTLTGIFGGLVSLISVLVMVFYLVTERKGLKHFIHFLAPREYQKYIANLVDRIQMKIGFWLRGQLTLMLIIGIMTYIGLLIMGVKYALLLALIAGITEIIPFVGPIIGAIPAIFIAFSESWVKALLVGVLYIIIQQLENHILVPKVMQKAVGLNPVVVIVAILIGVKLGGIIGALLAVPVAAMIGVFLSDIMPDSMKNTKSTESIEST